MSIHNTIIQRVTDMPMLPVVVSRLLEIIGDESHSTTDIVRVVENDPSLTTRVLRVANSAAFFRGNPISTLGRAIGHLGEKMVVDIAVGSCTVQMLNRPLRGYDSALGELWDHSLCTAISAREITHLAQNGASPDLAFTSGLLHDIGKAVLSEFLEGNVEKITALWDRKQVQDYLEGEKDIVGTDHTEVGYEIAKHWRLPKPLCEVIKHHHHPDKTDKDNLKLVYIVHLGDIIAMMGGSGTGADAMAYRIDPEYQHYIPINKNDLSQLFLTVQERFQSTKSSILASEEV
jgi:putative nucleotidyltransferase with HDIG domain